MNVYSYVITKNEADRYLAETITSLRCQVDGVCVFDDQSSDRTTDVLRGLGIQYMISADRTFGEGEAAFREDAWRYMERLFSPGLGDWILTLDADEALRLRKPLKDIIRLAERDNHDSLVLPVREIWEEGKMRIDGFWGTVSACRMALWRPNGVFKPEQMGGGSLPSYVSNKGHTSDAEILHYGYMKPEDRIAKYNRYSASPGRHNPRHIKSILAHPMLADLPNMV